MIVIFLMIIVWTSSGQSTVTLTREHTLSVCMDDRVTVESSLGAAEAASPPALADRFHVECVMRQPEVEHPTI